VTLKIKTAHRLGFKEIQDNQPATLSESDLLALIDKYNRDDSIHGILVQLPLPKQVNEKKVLNAIDPDKDVDGFHPVNVAKLALGDDDAFVPCTPLGCQRLLIESGIETAGANVVVLGRSMIVGKPMALLLMNKGRGGDATVTVAHSRTRDLAEVCRRADILIAAIGRAEFVKADMVREGAVVIDVGINRVADASSPKGAKLVGDVAFAEVAPKCRAITPVPGGVGPMTIAMLMHNTVLAARRSA
jgi:methylenetetrahydrofolate dehydrogenase (NADP+)/methenyltetrahydrofolate cyclohydrolase